MRCMDCGYSCHEKCTDSVTKNCTKYKAVTDSTLPQNLAGNGGDNGSVSSGSLFFFLNTLPTVYRFYFACCQHNCIIIVTICSYR